MRFLWRRRTSRWGKIQRDRPSVHQKKTGTTSVQRYGCGPFSGGKWAMEQENLLYYNKSEICLKQQARLIWTVAAFVRRGGVPCILPYIWRTPRSGQPSSVCWRFGEISLVPAWNSAAGTRRSARNPAAFSSGTWTAGCRLPPLTGRTRSFSAPPAAARPLPAIPSTPRVFCASPLEWRSSGPLCTAVSSCGGIPWSGWRSPATAVGSASPSAIWCGRRAPGEAAWSTAPRGPLPRGRR